MIELLLTFNLVLLILIFARQEDLPRRLRIRRHRQPQVPPGFDADPLVAELQVLTAALSEISRSIDQASATEIFNRN